MKKIIVLGASGTIGRNTVDIIRHFPECFLLTGVSVHSNVRELETLRTEFHITDFAVTDTAAAASYEKKHGSLERFLTETPADIVVNGIAGAAGLQASLIAVRTHRTLALANKESIVMAGALLQKEAEKHGCTIIPVDSEHSAIYSLIAAHGRERIAAHPYRIRRPLSNMDTGADSTSDIGRCAQTSDVDDGSKNHDRFGLACE